MDGAGLVGARNTAPIQPEAADNTIGGPGSVENAVDALTVGITHIGVLSQYSWRWPYWDDEVSQTMAVLKAAGALAAFKDDGVCFDSYLEDGYPGVFHDYANYVGWAMLERYICEQLIGAAYSCSWGGLTQDPVVKSAVTLALDAVHPDRVPAGFVQGDTIGNTPDFDSNMAVVSSDVLFMKMVDRRYRLGGAPIAVPVTETERIPSWQEVARADDQPAAGGIRADGRSGHRLGPIEALRDGSSPAGGSFFHAALAGVSAAGIDTGDPPACCSSSSGSARPLRGAVRGRRARPRVSARAPPDPADRPGEEHDGQARAAAGRAGRAAAGSEDGMKARLASTDVHEFAEFLLASALRGRGTEVIDFGINRDPEDIVKAVIETDADAVVVTTHNGVARSFGQLLMSELGAAELGRLPVFMGGVLNEDIEGARCRSTSAPTCAVGIRTPMTAIDELVATDRRRPAAWLGRVALADFGSTYTKLRAVDRTRR